MILFWKTRIVCGGSAWGKHQVLLLRNKGEILLTHLDSVCQVFLTCQKNVKKIFHPKLAINPFLEHGEHVLRSRVTTTWFLCDNIDFLASYTLLTECQKPCQKTVRS